MTNSYPICVKQEVLSEVINKGYKVVSSNRGNLWVKEAFYMFTNEGIEGTPKDYEPPTHLGKIKVKRSGDTWWACLYKVDHPTYVPCQGFKWLSAARMPKWASRFDLIASEAPETYKLVRKQDD